MQPNELSGGVATPNEAAGAAGQAAATTAALPPRRGLFGFKMPNVRADLPALPHELRTNRWIWLAAALLLSAAGAYYVLPSVPSDLSYAFVIFIELMVRPPALPVLLGGFFARRAPYLVGGVLGLLNGLIYAVLASAPLPGTPASAGSGLDPLSAFLNATVMGALFGGIAGWYRKFLSENNARTRAARDAREAEKRRKAKQDARGAKPAR
jgi:Na+/proline symporter